MPGAAGSASCRWRSIEPIAAGVSFDDGRLIDADGAIVARLRRRAEPARAAQLAERRRAPTRPAAGSALARGGPRGPASFPACRTAWSRSRAPAMSSGSTTARPPTPTRRRSRWRASPTSSGSPAASPSPAASQPARALVDRVRAAYLIGEAAERSPAELRRKLPFDRCGDLHVGADALPARAPPGATATRGCRAAGAGLRLLRPVRELRGRGDAFRALARALPAPSAWEPHDLRSAHRPLARRQLVVDRRPRPCWPASALWR